MQINITARDFGGTEFLAQPHRLHLAHRSRGCGQLEFSLPEQWNGCVVTLTSARGRHAGRAAGAGRSRLRRRGPKLYRLGQRRVDAGRCQRQWLHRLHPSRPVRRPRHPPHRGGGEELTPSIYEQFIARVVDSANAAAEAAKRAASGEANAKQSASEAAVSAQQTAASATLAAGYAEQAEAAATVPPPMLPRRALC